MLKKILILGAMLTFTSFVYAEEQITITTYYPSPYGVYQTLRLYPNNDHPWNSPCAATEEGYLTYNVSAHEIYVCNGSNWVTLGGVSEWGKVTIPAGNTFWTATFKRTYPTPPTVVAQVQYPEPWSGAPWQRVVVNIIGVTTTDFKVDIDEVEDVNVSGTIVDHTDIDPDRDGVLHYVVFYP